jgi:uncharacterized membrane protein YciS (DUF1049 family)
VKKILKLRNDKIIKFNYQILIKQIAMRSAYKKLIIFILIVMCIVNISILTKGSSNDLKLSELFITAHADSESQLENHITDPDPCTFLCVRIIIPGIWEITEERAGTLIECHYSVGYTCTPRECEPVEPCWS